MNHNEVTLLTVPFSEMVQSVMGRIPRSIGDELVQSIVVTGASGAAESAREAGAETKTSGATESNEG